MNQRMTPAERATLEVQTKESVDGMTKSQAAQWVAEKYAKLERYGTGAAIVVGGVFGRFFVEVLTQLDSTTAERAAGVAVGAAVFGGITYLNCHWVRRSAEKIGENASSDEYGG